MDQVLRERLIKIDKQIEKLYEAEMEYLSLDAAKDHKLSAIMLGDNDQTLNQSMNAKEMRAKATPEWDTFRQGLAQAEAKFHREKHRYELQLKAFDGCYLSLKVEAPVIARQK